MAGTMRHEGLLLNEATLKAERELLVSRAATFGAGVTTASPHLSIVDLPSSLVPTHSIGKSFVVLIDVQRMTTTLTTALAEGAEKVRVFTEIEEVQAAAKEYEQAARLRGGERHGQQIPGFDGDNSPRAYLRSVLDLRGKTLLFTTSNGSKAAQFVKEAAELVLGSFVNLQAVRRAALSRGYPVLLVCSGTAGERSEEDELFAGVLALQLLQIHSRTAASVPVQGEVADPLTLEIVERVASILGVAIEITVSGKPDKRAERVSGAADVGPPAQRAMELEQTIRNSTNGLMLAQLGLVDDFQIILDVDRYSDTLPVYNRSADCFTIPQNTIDKHTAKRQRCADEEKSRMCRRCKQDFKPSKNDATSCRYHPEIFSGETKQRWMTAGDTNGLGEIHYFWTCWCVHFLFRFTHTVCFHILGHLETMHD